VVEDLFWLYLDPAEQKGGNAVNTMKKRRDFSEAYAAIKNIISNRHIFEDGDVIDAHSFGYRLKVILNDRDISSCRLMAEFARRTQREPGLFGFTLTRATKELVPDTPVVGRYIYRRYVPPPDPTPNCRNEWARLAEQIGIISFQADQAMVTLLRLVKER
jgi:hypothetical protein